MGGAFFAGGGRGGPFATVATGAGGAGGALPCPTVATGVGGGAGLGWGAARVGAGGILGSGVVLGIAATIWSATTSAKPSVAWLRRLPPQVPRLRSSLQPPRLRSSLQLFHNSSLFHHSSRLRSSLQLFPCHCIAATGGLSRNCGWADPKLRLCD